MEGENTEHMRRSTGSKGDVLDRLKTTTIFGKSLSSRCQHFTVGAKRFTF